MTDRGQVERLQYGIVYGLLVLARRLPMWLLTPLAAVVATGAYWLLPRRRRLANTNVHHALGDDDTHRIAQASFRSFALTSMPEVVKLRGHLLAPDAREWMRRRSPEAEAIFTTTKKLHEQYEGCIFVTPHIGNWELLPYVAAAVGIPLVIPVRPLDNGFIEDLLARSRDETGQVFLDKWNALMKLQHHLGRGRSAAILADQNTLGGVAAPFFGRPALTTPVPALLAVRYERPIVVVACLRTGALRFTGWMGEPIFARVATTEKAEVLRLTEEMNRSMEQVIRAYPDQYLWMHDRWKKPQ